MTRISDEEYYEHWGRWYPLEDEKDTIVALLSMAAARFRANGFPEPVNVVEIGWNLENHFLNVCFVSNPDYYCYGQMPSAQGVSRRGTAISQTSSFRVPSWAFLLAQTSPNLPSGALLRVLDHERVEIERATIPDAVGRNLLRVVMESREEVFAGISFTDPHWLVVYFNDDGGSGKLVRVSRNGMTVYASEDVPLTREWFAEQSKL
jgi:hypothetical protein